MGCGLDRKAAMSCDPDEFRYGLMLAYLELETALGAIQADYEFLDKDRSPEDAVDALLRAPVAAKCIRAATQIFHEKIVALQRRSFQVLQGGRQ
jgi:hypothetical protein